MQRFKRIAGAALVLCTTAFGVGMADASPLAAPVQTAQPRMLMAGGGPDHWDRYRDNLERRDRHGNYSRNYSRRSRCYTEWQTVWTYYGPRIEPVRICERGRRGRGW